MFDNRKIKHLRRLPDGNSIVLIWVMLLTMAGRCNSGGMIFLTENIPYTPKMLSDELDFEESTVQLALEALERLGMIRRDADGILAVTGWEEHQNIEGMDRIREQTRKRVAEHRSRKKQLELPDRYGNVTVTVCNATDKEEDIDKDNNTCSFCDAQKADFESFWKVYPKKVAKKEAFKAFKKIKTPVSILIDAVEKQKKSDQWTRDHGQYIPYPTTWLNQERWVMEDDDQKTNQKFSGITYI
nr:MAG TPA: replisome organizer [Caudoviricetes sp.]